MAFGEHNDNQIPGLSQHHATTPSNVELRSAGASQPPLPLRSSCPAVGSPLPLPGTLAAEELGTSRAPTEALDPREAAAAGAGAASASERQRSRDARRHVKTNHTCITPDNWKLHLVRTQQPDLAGTRSHPVLLVPGLGSSGAYTFDLSPVISVADYLASHGWDVWIAELRGNGQSDKPSLLRGRSRWWTIDDYVRLDMPAVIAYVCGHGRSSHLHVMGHSMGGMILTRILALNGVSAARIRSATIIGSSPFLEGTFLRLYSWVAFSCLSIPPVDALYCVRDNAEPALARALLARNFSSISPGVILQFSNAFQPKGLMTPDLSEAYADPKRMAMVRHPVLVLVGDRDRMCPPWGARKAFDLLGSQDKRFVCLGPKNGQRMHYGHFDILMGRNVEEEVFPTLHEWLAIHDMPTVKPRVGNVGDNVVNKPNQSESNAAAVVVQGCQAQSSGPSLKTPPQPLQAAAAVGLSKL